MTLEDKMTKINKLQAEIENFGKIPGEILKKSTINSVINSA